jgi:hypothetical protein
MVFSKYVSNFYTHIFMQKRHRLPEASRATTHNLTLAYQLSIELGSIKREVDVKVDAVKGTLWGIHALKVLFEVLP